jgi:endonuclease/exonuclease/phosphatase family metal-dependent hydrolase
LILNALLAALLLIIYISVHISPARSWIFAFLSLSYPFVLFLNLFFVIWWILFRKWFFILSLICILLGWGYLKSSFQINFKNPKNPEEGRSLHLLTYNVRLFNYYEWNKDTSAWTDIFEYIRKQDPDIVCFQEFIALPGTRHDLANMKQHLKSLSYTHVYYTDRIPGKLDFGIATFSKYPIVRKEMIEFDESLNGSMSSDIVIGTDTIRIYNCHLQSIRLRNDYNDLLDSLIFNYNEKQLDELKDITIRLRQAYIQRARQVDILTRHIASSAYPVIVCGDFNDTPVSYTYKSLSKNKKDVFIESGSGIGTTFRGNFPFVRIDYILYSPWFKSEYYQAEKVNWSDHYPVRVRFRLNEMADSADRHSPRK